jgi:hypothetical protein
MKTWQKLFGASTLSTFAGGIAGDGGRTCTMWALFAVGTACVVAAIAVGIVETTEPR